jgi:mRNA interferase MazF
MTAYEFGDVVLVPFPFTDQSTTKRRPAVVVSCAFSLSDRPLPPLLSQNRESVSHAQPAPAVW